MAIAPDLYTCIAAAASFPSGASDCNACLAQGANAKSCLLCRPAVKTPAGFWCSSCWGQGKSPENASKCQDCLAKTQGNANSGYSEVRFFWARFFSLLIARWCGCVFV